TALVGEAHEVKTKVARLAHVFGLLAAVGALSLLVVWSSYGFHGRLSSDPAVRDELRRPLVSEQAGFLRSAVAWAGRARLVPEDFSRGLLFVTEHSAARPTFLLGERRDSGFPYYFAVTFLLKTPVPLLLLAALALFRIPRLARREAFLLSLPVAVSPCRSRSPRRSRSSASRDCRPARLSCSGSRSRSTWPRPRRAGCRSATATCCRSILYCSSPPGRPRPRSAPGARPDARG